MQVFKNRILHFATMHGKEEIVAVPFKESFDIEVETVPINTDLLGTFTGEIERPSDPVSVARMKIEMARERIGDELFLASEGSFGPHPSFGILPCNEEWLVLKDYKNQLEIISRGVYLETNFGHTIIKKEEDLISFAKSIGFPDHGIILRAKKDFEVEIIKGIRDFPNLLDSYREIKERSENVHAESDMRAMMNPTRQKCIYKTALELIARMKSLCPSCGLPGWSVTSYQNGLPCSLCGMPTKSSLYANYSCLGCDYSQKIKYPHQKETEDPMYCDFCNP